MATDNHNFIEAREGTFAVRAKGSKRASVRAETQEEAIRIAKRLNPNDNPDVERIRNREQGGRDQWRTAS